MTTTSSSSLIAALLDPLPPIASGGACDLGDPAIVELLVRNFVDQTFSVFHRVLAGEATQDDASEAIYGQALGLNALFLGTAEFKNVVSHPWNSPDQLGSYIQDTVDFDFPPEECVRAAFVHMATHVMRLLKDEPDDWKLQVDGLVGELRDLLLGRVIN